MKIRCEKCYRVLNPNEEYCTNCGEHSAKMQQAMLTGNYGPDNVGKFKIAFGIFALVGFIVCGALQITFAMIENKINNENGYTSLFCQTNSLFYSSILTLIVTLIAFRKDLKNYFPTMNLKQLLGSLLIAFFTITIVVLLTNLTNVTLIFPKYIVEYLKEGNPRFFDMLNPCILKIVVSSILVGVGVEILGRKYLVDALDETMLSDRSIYLITSLVTTLFEIVWVMSLDVAIISLIINFVATGIYMYANRNLLINIIIRIMTVIIAVIVFI